MIVREHVWCLGKCLFCGAKDLPTLIDEARALGREGVVEPEARTCIERQDGQSGLRPEPVRRQYASESFDAIHDAMMAIREAAKPICPVTSQALERCLKSSARCGDNCTHQEFWTGPDADAGIFC